MTVQVCAVLLALVKEKSGHGARHEHWGKTAPPNVEGDSDFLSSLMGSLTTPAFSKLKPEDFDQTLDMKDTSPQPYTPNLKPY